MDLVAFYEARQQLGGGTHGGGRGTLCVWGLSSGTASVLGVWEEIAVDHVCLSGVSMRLGILSRLAGTLVVCEIVTENVLFHLQYDRRIGYTLDLVCNDACDKVAMIGSSRCGVYDVDNKQPMYEFTGAEGIVFSHDNAFVYVQYKFKVVQCDIATGAELKVFEDSKREISTYSLIQSPCGSRIAWQTEVSGGHEQIVILDTVREAIHTKLRCEARHVYSFRDAGALMTEGREFVELLEIETGESVPTVVKARRIVEAAATVEGSVTVFRLTPGGIRVVDLATGQRAGTLTCPYADYIFAHLGDYETYYFGFAVSCNQQQTILL
jgi:hypothetical protein